MLTRGQFATDCLQSTKQSVPYTPYTIYTISLSDTDKNLLKLNLQGKSHDMGTRKESLGNCLSFAVSIVLCSVKQQKLSLNLIIAGQIKKRGYDSRSLNIWCRQFRQTYSLDILEME